MCVGSIISKLHILTSKTCVYKIVQKPDQSFQKGKFSPSDINVLVGTENSYPDPWPHRHEVVSVKESDKFAILTLKTPLDFDADTNIAPLCLPEKYGKDYKGKNVKIYGWGYSQQYREDTYKIFESRKIKQRDFQIISNCKSKPDMPSTLIGVSSWASQHRDLQHQNTYKLEE